MMAVMSQSPPAMARRIARKLMILPAAVSPRSRVKHLRKGSGQRNEFLAAVLD
jgi:hypothetical protein